MVCNFPLSYLPDNATIHEVYILTIEVEKKIPLRRDLAYVILGKIYSLYIQNLRAGILI